MPDETKPAFAVLSGRLAEALGHEKDALDDYKFAVGSTDRQAAARAKLLEIALKQKRNEISREDALRELETLAMIWRGDATEVKTLQMLAQIYDDTGHYAESLEASRISSPEVYTRPEILTWKGKKYRVYKGVNLCDETRTTVPGGPALPRIAAINLVSENQKKEASTSTAGQRGTESEEKDRRLR